MRIHTTSEGLDPRRLRPAGDLVLAIPELHGVDLATGVLANDHLDLDARRRVDGLALAAVADWRELLEADLTVDGVNMSWVWEWELFEAFGPVIASALGLRRAIEVHSPAALELADDGEETARLARSIGAAAGLQVTVGAGRRSVPDAGPERRAPRARRIRRRAVQAATTFGAPSLLRRDALGFESYWPLMPALDRMLERRDLRPAICLQKRPTGPRRSLRAATRGGFVGMPGRGDRRAARAAATRLLERASAAAPQFDVDGLPLGATLHGHAVELIRRRAVDDIANIPMLRRAFARGRVSRLFGTYDLEPSSRLVVALAQEAGVPATMLAHGAFILPQPMADLEVCDEVVLWTEAVAPPFKPRGRPVHVIGYPLPHDPVPTRVLSAAPEAPTVVVLAQSWVPSTAIIDARATMRHYEAAVMATLDRFPRATVVLRPHPSHGLAPIERLIDRFGADRIKREADGDILDLLRRADLCIGAATTATLQSALVGTPVIMLNVTGCDWPWPLGGESTVPVARSAPELAAALDRFAREGTLPGADDMLSGLGAHGGDPADRLLEILAGPPALSSGHREPSLSAS